MDARSKKSSWAVTFLFLTSLVLPASARDVGVLVWDSGYESLCNGSCVLALRNSRGISFRFTDPADGKTVLYREVVLPKGARIGNPKYAGSISTQDQDESKDLGWLSTLNAVYFPPPPAGGTGVVSTEAPIYDSFGDQIGTAIFRYYFINSYLVNVTVDYVNIDQGSIG